VHKSGIGYRLLSVQLLSSAIEHGANASFGFTPNATIVEISFVLADHADAPKSGEASAFRKACQIQTKEQTPGFAFLLQ
jgi:hypothetical protein